MKETQVRQFLPPSNVMHGVTIGEWRRILRSIFHHNGEGEQEIPEHGKGKEEHI